VTASQPAIFPQQVPRYAVLAVERFTRRAGKNVDIVPVYNFNVVFQARNKKNITMTQTPLYITLYISLYFMRCIAI